MRPALYADFTGRLRCGRCGHEWAVDTARGMYSTGLRAIMSGGCETCSTTEPVIECPSCHAQTW